MRVSKKKFPVEVTIKLKLFIKEDIGRVELGNYIADAAESYNGCFSPDDPLFGGVKVDDWTITSERQR